VVKKLRLSVQTTIGTVGYLSAALAEIEQVLGQKQPK
jgi:hypothetical protein